MKKKEFQNLLPKRIQLEGFKYISKPEGIFYHKEDDDWIYYVNISASYYASVNASISAGEIENKQVTAIYKSICNKYTHIQKHSIILNSLIIKKTTQTRDFNIFNEQDLDEVIPIWKKDINEIILPFFDQWSNLKKINDEIIDKFTDWDALHKYMPGNTPFLKFIIMKLCNNPNYKYFTDVWLPEISIEAKNDPQEFGEYYKAACELRDILNKTEPIYK